MQALSRRNALRMVRGSGDGTVTQYNAGVVEQAKEDGVAILVTKTDPKTGKVQIVPRRPRMVHRPDLPAVFGDTHPQAGEGKYISLEAYPKGDPNSKVVIGAQHVNPYLRSEGCYATIVNAFLHNIGKAKLSKLRAQMAHTRAKSDHLLWEGRRDKDGSLVTSEWMTAEEVWSAALAFNPELGKALKQSRSGRKDVTAHKSAQEKFFGDLDVMRRATRKVDALTGDVEYTGGATPYAAPLEQCGFAIDQRYLTYGTTADGEELAQYYYRLAIGRPEPHPLSSTSWARATITSAVAFLSKKIQSAARKSLRAA